MRRFSALLTIGAAAVACTPGVRIVTNPTPASASITSNPFYAPSTLPYQAPDFTKIRESDYRPGFAEGMRQHLAEIDAIVNNPAPATFDNTIVAMERSGQMLTRVAYVFDGVNQSNTTDTLKKIDEEMAPKRAGHGDAIFLNDKLFQRVKAVYDTRTTSGLDAVQQWLVQRYYTDFVRSGAQLSEADKVTFRALNQEESKLTTSFHSKLLEGRNAAALVVDNVSELAGLSPAQIASAAETAKQRGMPGKWVLTVQNTTQQPAQVSLTNRATRQKLFEKSILRGERGDSNDTRGIVSRLAQLRAEKAKLLGYPTWADFRLTDVMAQTSANATQLLTSIVPAATAKARADAAVMQALIDKQGGGFKVAPWDWQYYAEKVRKDQYDFDGDQVKPYFEINNVLKNGLFYAANRMYGITFKERNDLPVYHPDVKVYDVSNEDGSFLGLYYADWFTRDNKAGGAWMSNFVDQSGLMGTKPVVYNVGNFAKPAPGAPALMTLDEVSTMFHEFGHALHGLFSDVKYPRIAGTNTPRDFVEYPSQFNEHWATEATVLANYAKHYQTGEPMPKALLDKFRAASKFDMGFATTEFLAASLLDMAWASIPPGLPLQDVNAFEAAALKRYNVAVAEIPPRYRTTYFSHIWDGGYSAGYYSYLWSEVLDADSYGYFLENGGMTRANGQRYRDMILSKGSTMDVATLFRNFRGRDPKVDQLLIERGLSDPQKK